MDHAGEGRLLAFLDGELTAAEWAALDGHLARCPACSEELSTLREAGAQLSASLRLLDATAAPATTSAAAVLARARGERVAAVRRTLLRAAGILLVLAGGGAAALPGSPVREWVRAAWDRGSALFGGGAVVEAGPAGMGAAAATPVGIDAAAVDGRIHVELWSLPAGTEVRVRLVDAPAAWIQAPAGEGAPPQFVRAPGLVQVTGGAAGVLRIDLPRGVDEARVEVDGRLRVFKDGDVLRLADPGQGGVGPEAVFRIRR